MRDVQGADEVDFTKLLAQKRQDMLREGSRVWSRRLLSLSAPAFSVGIGLYAANLDPKSLDLRMLEDLAVAWVAAQLVMTCILAALGAWRLLAFRPAKRVTALGLAKGFAVATASFLVVTGVVAFAVLQAQGFTPVQHAEQRFLWAQAGFLAVSCVAGIGTKMPGHGPQDDDL